MSLYRAVSRTAASRIRPMSTRTAPAAEHEEKTATSNNDDDQPIWNMSNPYSKERRKCIICANGIVFDYKNVQLISQFVSPHTGKLYDRHITGLCLPQQIRLKKAYGTAQLSLRLPAYFKDLKFVKDPKLFDPFNPQRPHPH
ncbi:28S ribosomal protein S18c [Tropilaelaps mercedesae]|uniref:28S ribosomal protein S18c n=1 Tax=Tropilaelaps mercedesae TaxID=418985 RepID=A0A1V9XS69_9ACAR|nr:28S ribosomal protein S18c [Tropilaelaps mercedesae]